LIIDEDTAVYVRRIYREFLSGGTILGIAHKLSMDKVPTPSEQKGLTATQKYFKGIWNDAIVRRILTNPTYAGHLTQNMTRKVSYKVDKKVRLPQSEWIVTKNTHEPIVSQEDFDAVAEILSKRSYHKSKRSGKQHLLSGLVFCKDCGGGMSFIKESETRTYLVCSRWRKNAKLGICTSHSIRESYVEEIIKDKLKELASAVNTSEILSDADAFLVNKNSNEKLIDTIRQKINGCKNTMLSLYKDKASGIISEDEFVELSESIKSERAVYEQRLRELQEEANSIKSAKDMSELLNGILSFENIDRNTLLMLIDKIYIDSNKNIEIQFKFDNPIT
ncbi:MAG: recombinase family protein, partial [Monoglobaceae bacterium]